MKLRLVLIFFTFNDICESAEESGWRALSPLTPLSFGSVAFLGPCASGFPDVFVTSCWCCCRSQEGLQGSCDPCWVCPVSAPSVCFPSLCGDWGDDTDGRLALGSFRRAVFLQPRQEK